MRLARDLFGGYTGRLGSVYWVVVRELKPSYQNMGVWQMMRFPHLFYLTKGP